MHSSNNFWFKNLLTSIVTNFALATLLLKFCLTKFFELYGYIKIIYIYTV